MTTPPAQAAAATAHTAAPINERGVMLDIGRKDFSPGWIFWLLDQMAERDLTTLQLHLSDGLGFRIASHAYPDVTSPHHLLRHDVLEILEAAEDRGITVIGDVDTPSHMEYLLRNRPEFSLRLADGRTLPGHLDLSLAAAREFVRDVVSDMVDLFRSRPAGARVFHLGGDEYFPAPWQEGTDHAFTDEDAPQLGAWAREVTGDQRATMYDAYTLYMNSLADLVRSRGLTARIWNDHVRPGQGVVRLDPQTQVDVWVRWNDTFPSATDIARQGHDLINSNGDYLYIILTEEGIGTGPWKNPQGVKSYFHPRRFMGAAGSHADHDVDASIPVIGSHLSIWCDHPDAVCEQELAAIIPAWLDAYAAATRSDRPLPPSPHVTLHHTKTQFGR
ncbi:family 20 glycosylhydrolase [Devriesea agamarum]|uniref:family 20 glycosylhydrolase n=1 Tax=Devriesea agamarum TaxID=472569 RepID=UPI00071CE6D2|nr:family 20 glycosylhydrolase [Devriesea agamarum]